MPPANTRDLTDTQWETLDNLIPRPTSRTDGRGRPWKDRRSVLNKLLDLQRPVQGVVRFTHDGKAVVYPFRDKEADNLWLQPLDGSPGKQITNFKSEQILDFHWSFDGSKLGMVRGHPDSDVVLLQESKP
jgi:hypothetical protein